MLKAAISALLAACLMGAAGAAPDTAGLSAEEREIVEAMTVGGANPRNIDAALAYWRAAPADLKDRVRAAPPEKRWSIIICNVLGFKIDAEGAANAERCEAAAYADTVRGAESWSSDGQWVGPSEACKARNKRNGYGQLICG
jgi:hypothetical protein